ncbi:hypothetical protein DCCM_4636 [Desulfocucumis palustris]|uniref:Uncharacterized protein n=1 Tax=Desulfocucumis palustris TaxID=1898651 RepID=A0A2L2XGL5_9FIRM|nr:hypothetical protein [Desulfocucumis palustris]GBF35507.1 hypothetical protein DCCM_4636 [Desulfocucumis palustris]
MENARLLDERLKKIIKEIGSKTGEEVKSLVIGDIIREVETITARNSQRQLIKMLSMLKKAVDDI